MQMLAIVLYSKWGDRRYLAFETGRVNIVDYCLGRSNCEVASGPIRNTVAWYGLLLQFKHNQLFIARENPAIGAKSTNLAFLLEGHNIAIPETISRPNTTSENIESRISELLNISPNMNFPTVDQTRLPLSANFRHGLIYSFQEQDEIAIRRSLFHRQGEPFMTQAIKDTLPYFLGVVQENALALEQSLRSARRDLRLLGRRLSEADDVQGVGLTRAISLIGEARQLGLLPPEAEQVPTDIHLIAATLRSVLDWIPEQGSIAPTSRLPRLIDRRRSLEDERQEINESILAAMTYAEEVEGFASEADEQRLRLQSIQFYGRAERNSITCPLCLQPLSSSIPPIDQIQIALRDLEANLVSVDRGRPQIRDFIDAAEQRRSGVETSLLQTDEEIQALYEQNRTLAQLRDANIARGRVIGRISLWLESVGLDDNLSELKQRISAVQDIVDQLESQLNPEEKRQRLNNILARLGYQMTQWAQSLNLEHSEPGNFIVFDWASATIAAQTFNALIPLRQMGSGENFLGYHLVAHFALHKHFVEASRPTPRFLFLDQPTQVYFPEEDQASEVIKESGAVGELSENDRRSVEHIFDFVFDVVELLAPEFQVIISDHADLTNSPRFQDSIRENWRNGIALIPQEWIERFASEQTTDTRD